MKTRSHNRPQNLTTLLQLLRHNLSQNHFAFCLSQTGKGLIQAITQTKDDFLTAENNVLPAFIDDARSHQSAVVFMEESRAKDGTEYKWVWEYAKGLWEYRAKSLSSIEDKADSIVRYLGSGTGLFTIGVLAKIDASNNYLVWWTLPALLCALFSIFVAVWVKKPDVVPSPPAIDNAKAYADGLGTEWKATAAFLGQWHVACVDMKLLCSRKAKMVDKAFQLFYLAVALLLVPLIVAAISPPVPIQK